MQTVQVLNKIYEDLESLKRDMAEIKIAIKLEPELREDIKDHIKEARARLFKGKFISNEEMLKEFSVE